ncbi:MAG: asparagine synthetase B family protein, partial [Desulfatiglandales bacterium]
MFSLAIWDKKKRLLILGRDRVGKKPLYYALNAYGIFFGSELKSLNCFSFLKRSLDLDSLALYLHYQYIPSPRSIFLDFYKLEPGTYLTYSEGSITKRTYWTPPKWVRGSDSKDERGLLEELRSLLREAVLKRLVADVPVGLLLSGGNDSSLVASIAQEVSENRLRTFTVSFEEGEYDEGPYAREVARLLGSDHTEVTLAPKEAVDLVPKIPLIYDEPFGDSSGIPTYLVSKIASSFVKVVITGDGGDEQFGGYVRYWAVNSLWNLKKAFGPLLRPASHLLSLIPQDMVIRSYELIKGRLPQRFLMDNMKDKYQKLLQILSFGDLETIYRLAVGVFSKEAVQALLGRRIPPGPFEESISQYPDLHPILRLMGVDQRTYLPDCMLTKVDRASMANGLEVRCPLLDTALWGFTRGLGIDQIYRNGT